MKENSDKTSASDLAEVSETVELDGMTDIDVRTVLVMMNAMESLEGEQLDQLAELFSTEEVENAEIVQEGAPLDRYRLGTAVKKMRHAYFFCRTRPSVAFCAALR